MQELRVATVFSGIGALEESLKQLDISHVIKFACDNGEREPKTDFKTIYKVAKSVLLESKAEDLIRLYINNLFTKRKIRNAVLEEDVHNLYKEIRPLDTKTAIKKIDTLDDMSFEGEIVKFKLRYRCLLCCVRSRRNPGRNPPRSRRESGCSSNECRGPPSACLA